MKTLTKIIAHRLSPQLLSRIYHPFLLIAVTLLAYVPFVGVRMIRTTGDEKVYIAQTLGMDALGNWFVQSLNGQPDYYKGPLHYLLMHVGLKVFGLSLWTAIYMNLLFAVLGAVALGAIVKEAFPEKKHWPFWAGTFFAFNVGIYGHFFASQMEVELAGIFVIAFYFLWRGKSLRSDLIFWILAGIAGWIKSPLHSVLLGVSAVLFWGATGNLVSRMKNPRAWSAAVLGVITCTLGYAPAYFLDRENFLRIYLQRETFKPPNGGAWWQAILPMVSYYLIPWMTITLLSFGEILFKILFRFKSLANRPKSEKRLLLFGLCTFIPTNLFFIYYPYRGENYAVPVTGSVILLVLFFLKNSSEKYLRIRNWILGVTCLPLIAIPVALQVFSFRFQLSAEVWPIWLMPLIWFLALTAVGLSVWEHFFKKTDGLGIRATLGKVCLISIVGLLLAVFGEMEVYPLKARIQEDQRLGKSKGIYYWNLNRLIWNEWALMSLAVHEKILPLLSEEEMSAAIRNGDLILARDTDEGKKIEKFAEKKFPHLKPVFYPWNRWKTHASDGAGNSLVGKAWREKDLSIIWDHALMMRFEG